ncbi:MAG: deoxyribodipyrimidine photo-lyase [Verrucomicrobiota bacterium]
MKIVAIAPERLLVLNQHGPREGDYVLYWMQQSQRAKWNHALEFAAARANALNLPLVVCFGITTYPEANARHYTFMLEGLAETAIALRERRIAFVFRQGSPAKVALELGRRAALLVCDRGYLRLQKAWRDEVTTRARCPVVQVESDVIVPVHFASGKHEYGARTLRPKVMRLYEKFLRPVRAVRLRKSALGLGLRGLSLDQPGEFIRGLKLDRTVPPVTQFFKGGTSEAERRFRKFLRVGLRDYRRNRNQPQTDDVSQMSKYLHFGQISPVWLAVMARRQKSPGNVAVFIEELLVRRELSMNFCEFVENYDRYEVLPNWARKSLAKHRRDRRKEIYSRAELESSATHDPYWNAAMTEMRVTGFMHNYMRMYWGKKMIEWSKTPEEAYATALALNNKYFLDGRDANSFANVAWLFGLHDRPWGEREIFGMVRYMSAAGLERKCDIRAYVEKVNEMAKQGEEED